MTEPEVSTVCYRHPDRVSGLSCSHCGRTICAECSHDAAVGQRCPDCLRAEGTQRVVRVGRPSGPRFSDAPVTYGLIGITAGIAVLAALSPALWTDTFFANLAMYGPAVRAGEWWRMVTVILVHAGFIHVGFNMLLTYQLGVHMEKSVGSAAYAALFVACAAVGSAFAMAIGPDVPGVGASGAVFGLVGTWLAPAIRGRSTAWGRGVIGQLGGLLVINAIVPFVMRNVSWEAHLGGLVAGFAIGWLWGAVPARRRSQGVRVAIALVVLVAAVVSGPVL